MSYDQNEAPHRNIPALDPAVKTQVRIYERQSDFSRDLRAMRRKGWALQTFHQTRSPRTLDLIQVSAPGMIPHEAEPQIVAHYACMRMQPAGVGSVRRRISRALIALATRLDQSEAGDETQSTSTCPA